MTIKVKVIDDGTHLKLNSEGGLNVSINNYPALDEEYTAVPYRQYFANSAGSTDMRVDGSSTNVKFYIEAIADYEIYV